MSAISEEHRLYQAILEGAPVLVTLDPEALARAAHLAIAHMRQQNYELQTSNGRIYHDYGERGVRLSDLEAKAQAVIDAGRAVKLVGGKRGRFQVALTELAELLEGGDES